MVDVTGRILDELDNAAQAIREMPAGGGFMMDIFVDEIRGLATEVRNHATVDEPQAIEPPDVRGDGALLDEASGS